MRWLPGLFMLSALCIIATLAMLVPTAQGAYQNFTEHSWVYNSGYMEDMRIYQTESGFNGQKLVTGTRGTGIISRTIDAEVYGGWGSLDEISMNEWGVFQNKPSAYSKSLSSQSLTQSDLRNALCAKNYAVGSVFSRKPIQLTKTSSRIPAPSRPERHLFMISPRRYRERQGSVPGSRRATTRSLHTP